MKKLDEIIRRIEVLEARFNNEKFLMTFDDVLKYLGFSKHHLYKLVYRKIIPFHKPTNGVLLFYKNEIDEWVSCSTLVHPGRRPL